MVLSGVLALDGDGDGDDAVAEATRQAREDDRLVPVLLALGDGLLAAVKTG